jgi:tRNA pseudouridine13 synthase
LIHNLPRAHGGPVAKGLIKQAPEDFVVDEILGFELAGEGEHVFLKIRKRGENTDYLARQIAKYAELPKMAVSYAGMKDRHAVATQWFSVHIPGKREVDWSGLASASVAVLESVRHNRKLKTGALKGNRFEIAVRELEGEREAVEATLARIREQGAPNYFGPQRFGREGNNVAQAGALFAGELKLRDRKLEGIYLSAARSEIFNRVLARRIEAGNWNRAIAGDAFMFNHGASVFRDDLSPAIDERLNRLEIHPSGPLWGKGAPVAEGEALAIEREVAGELARLSEGLERIGMESARRALRLAVPDLSWEFPDPNSLRLSFSLPAGAYATSVLREIVDCEGALD